MAVFNEKNYPFIDLGDSGTNENTPSRVYKIKLYYKDSPTPMIFDNVWHIQTEGQLLRLIVNGKSQWIPLNNVAYFKEIDKIDK